MMLLWFIKAFATETFIVLIQCNIFPNVESPVLSFFGCFVSQKLDLKFNGRKRSNFLTMIYLHWSMVATKATNADFYPFNRIYD